MRRNDTGTPKKKTRRAAGQMVASAVMALAIAVGGFGTTALLASQPAGLTVEPSALLWEGESNAAHSTKEDVIPWRLPFSLWLCILGGGEHRCVCRAARCPQPE